MRGEESYYDQIPGEKSPIINTNAVVITELRRDSRKLRRTLCYTCASVAVSLTVVCMLVAVVWTARHPLVTVCHDDGNCQVSIVESIPENLTYPAGSPSHPSIYDAWMRLIDSATTSIDIAAFYWTLQSSDIKFNDPSDWKGANVLRALISAARDRKIKLRIVNNVEKTPDNDTVQLVNAGAEVRSVDFMELFKSGVLHTKMWVVDDKHTYIGSANMDYRSLTQVKELGTVIENCSCVAEDALKIFEVYWYLGVPHTHVPSVWPRKYDTLYNSASPMSLQLNYTPSQLYLSSSPAPLCPDGRTSDINAILDVIQHAQTFIHIAVMDYVPSMLYVRHKRFWPMIDDALRASSLERGVRVRLLASMWNHTKPDMIHFLRSLADVDGAMKADIEVKLFIVPAFTTLQSKVPFGRVNHNKYMVTDNVAYIGTSNWSEDYFVTTAGAGVIINQTASTCSNSQDCDTSSTTVQQQLAAIFDRDWNSTYAHPLPS